MQTRMPMRRWGVVTGAILALQEQAPENLRQASWQGSLALCLTQNRNDLGKLEGMNILQAWHAHGMPRHEGGGILPRISKSG
jgi:hypothetical protein